MHFEYNNNPFAEVCYIPSLKYYLECDGRPVNESCLTMPDTDVQAHTFFVLENFQYSKLHNYLAISKDILKQISVDNDNEFRGCTTEFSDAREDCIYSGWNYLFPDEEIKNNVDGPFQKLNDESRYMPVYYKYINTSDFGMTIYKSKRPFCSDCDLFKSVYPDYDNFIVIYINLYYFIGSDAQANLIELQSTIAHEVTHVNQDRQTPEYSHLHIKPYGVSTWFEEGNPLDVTGRARIICKNIAYVFSKEEREARINEICAALELYLERNDMREYFTKVFYHICHKHPVYRSFADFHEVMMQALLRTAPMFKIHDIYDTYRYVVLALSDKNKFTESVTWTHPDFQNLTLKDRLQVIIAIGYVLKYYNMLTYKTDNERKLVEKWLSPSSRITLITHCEQYIDDQSFSDFLDVLERNIVDQLHKYIDDIYTVVDNYADRCLEYIGIVYNSLNGRPTYRHDLRPEQLTLIKECLSYKRTDGERRFTHFHRHCDII